LEKDPETARYVEPLKDVVLARLFQQLAQVYASLKIDRVVKLAGFASDGEKEVTRKRVERFVTESCRQGDLDVTIDHASGSIKFDEDLFGSDSTPVASTSAYDKDLQPSAATLLRTHLTRLASTLYATLDVVSPDTSPLAAALVARTLAFADLEARSADERHMLLMRNRIILKRQEFADEQQARKQKEEAHQRTVRAALKAEEDAKKQKDDLRARELEKIRKDLAAQRQAEAIKMAEALAAKSGLKVDLKVTLIVPFS
jgi:translation initiation factor 3 subunit A